MKMNKSSTTKNTVYRDTLLKKIGDDLSHPIFNGVSMQAHHVVSAKGLDISSAESQMNKVEYDINEVENLVFIPCTFQGACHLNTQLHRSNHTTTKKKEGDLDDAHPRSYHQAVAELVDAVYERNISLCPFKNQKKILDEYKAIPSVILLSINNFDRDTQLTRAYESFDIKGPLSNIGCAGKNKMEEQQSLKGEVVCPVGRDHEYRESLELDGIEKPEEISLTRKNTQYILKLGN